MKTIESDGSRRLLVEAVTNEDPTATPPEFCVTTGERSNPSGWVAGGLWSSTWRQKDGRVDAQTPLIGTGQALNVAPGLIYDLWIRYSTPSASGQIDRVGSILVR